MSPAPRVRVRRSHRIVAVAVLIAVAVNTDGRREMLGMDIGPSEAETFWAEFLRKLRQRELRGTKLIISDAHEGIKAAVTKLMNMTPAFAGTGMAALPRAHHAQRPGPWPIQRGRYMTLKTIAGISDDLAIELPAMVI